MLLSRSCEKTLENDEEHTFFAEILGLLRSTLFEFFEKPEYLQRFLQQKIPQNCDLQDFFLENFLINPAESHESLKFSFFSAFFQEIPAVSLQFLKVFCLKSPEIQRFVSSKLYKLIDFCVKHRENLELDATKIKEIFKNKAAATVHHTHPGFEVLNKFKPDFVDFELLELAPLAVKNAGFSAKNKEFGEELTNFELNLSEEGGIQEKSQENLEENEEETLKDPQMLRFRRKNVETVKKAVQILWEVLRECAQELPGFLRKMLRSCACGEKRAKNETFVSVLMDFCVFQRFLSEFERTSAEKTQKYSASSINCVVKCIFEGKKTAAFNDFEEFIEEKRQELREICEEIEEKLRENAEEEEKCEENSVNLKSYLVNIENIDKIVGFMLENEEFFSAKNSRLVKNCKM